MIVGAVAAQVARDSMEAAAHAEPVVRERRSGVRVRLAAALRALAARVEPACPPARRVGT
jgi:hypothetical protein